jgi:5-methylcytosine-specific restriction endonuclease McrA
MRASLRRLLRLAATSDTQAVPDGDGWRTRCLHCRAHLELRADGEALGATSLEHVIAQAWFGRREAGALTARVGGDPDDPRNLALACKSCNQAKGTTHDARGPGDPRAFAVIAALLDRRLARWCAPRD